MHSTPLVTVSWLSENKSNPNLVILDATNKPADESLNHLRIPAARFFDIKTTFSDTNNPFPNAFPSQEKFEKEARKLGINKNSMIVIYDRHGIYSSPRAWWLFRTMGHTEVYVLDGGFPLWISNGLPTELITEEIYSEGDFNAHLDTTGIRSFDDIKANLTTKEECIIDARSAGRFSGTVPEPRAGLRGGHIPHSYNLPFSELIQAGQFKSKDELKEYFSNIPSDGKTLTFSCGSGITACIVLLAAEIAGIPTKKRIYDGSWTEWASLELG